ncbi:Hsp20/alpha crystallin family protein [Lutibaculum baratangense]|uniref:Molecular chaperone (Small heat shock protein)-like protein n=1 Tax=Lutibaculum baratangense AMV1 TaxID=631454 RepID=V4T981_9HYPH|nr:Hsp20/alpha crystallin family protein [Lutibaculum baratangense]ESR23088.1 Molecular chaperone (small heat shock protein)-like protein [Lutibaculum baratangense AMV1]
MARDRANWMLAEALESLARAERMQQQFFQLRAAGGARAPAWEPPIDMIETDREVIVHVALPGVDPEKIEARIEDGVLVVAGHRVLPPELRNAVIHRLELPQGRFERRIPLPPGRYAVRHGAGNGCLVFTLTKAR